jgi:hypothetical protein
MILTASLVFLFGCSNPTGGGGGGGNGSGSTSMTTRTYSEDFGTTPTDVYFVFTNPTYEGGGANPTISSDTVGPQSSAIGADGRSRPVFTERPEVRRGTPEITAWNDRPFERAAEAPGRPRFSRLNAAPPEPSFAYNVGDTRAFMYDSTSNTVGATLRKKLSATTGNGNRELQLWVADDAWDGAGEKTHEVTIEMLDAIAPEFLAGGDSNDIYDWVTNIYGSEWATTPYDNLIPETNQIVILFKDINGDDAPNGGTVGYFWSKNNFTQDAIAYSNETVMFVIDSVMFANPVGNGGGTTDTEWHIEDYWPQDIILTLAHEFQHMIHFYQKNVLQSDGYTDTWLNEMASLATEDLVADKVAVRGPRGITGGSAGLPYITGGRLPLFNYWNDISLVNWGEVGGTLPSYSMAYAFGAYLMRNYGGAPLMGDIVQNGYTDMQAVLSALASRGYSETEASLLQGFAEAVLRSDDTATIAPTDFNSGTWFSSSIDGMAYDLGSINLFNYSYSTGEFTLNGPYLYDASAPSYWFSEPYPMSNMYFLAGEGLTGPQSWDITMPETMEFMAVRKEQ